MTVVKLVGIGVAAGFFSALFGVGGGVVIVPLLGLMVGLDQRRSSGISLAAILIAAAAGAVTYALHGQIKLGAASLVGIPAVAGVLLGTELQQRVPVRRLSYAFSLLLALIGVRLIV